MLAEKSARNDAHISAFRIDDRQIRLVVMRETRCDLLVFGGHRDPALQAMQSAAAHAPLGRGALGMNDAASRRHPVDLAGADRLRGAEAVAMHDLAVKQEGQRGKPDMRVWPNIDALAVPQHGRSKVVEEDEGADHSTLRVRESAADRKAAEIDAARHDDLINRLAGRLVAWGRVLAREGCHGWSLGNGAPRRGAAGICLGPYNRHSKQPEYGHRASQRSGSGAIPCKNAFRPRRQWGTARNTHCEEPPAGQLTSSGSVPVGLPLASSVIFSTRASAWRNNSSQRRLRFSPRS